MNRFAFTLLTLLFTSSIWGQTLSTNPTGTSPLSLVAGPGDTYYGPAPAAGDHVPGEFIIYFKNKLNEGKDEEDFLEYLDKFTDAELIALSPRRSYGLIRVERLAQNSNLDACDLIGEGNTLIGPRGGGDTLSLNYLMGTDYIDHGNNSIGYLGMSGGEPDYAQYEINGDCNSQYQLLPEVTNDDAYVSIGVIDGGMYIPSGSNGTLNDVSVSQESFPMSGNVIRSTRPQSYSRHGRDIMSLISGAFRSKGLQDRLSLISYRVMDEDLKATLFDVVSAIEYATMPGTPTPQILSLSIGFKPASCAIIRSMEAVDNVVLRTAINTAHRYGILVITSAGNSGESLDANPQYPAAEEGLYNLITVGSLHCIGDNRAGWSNWSSSLVDFFTVGEDVNILFGDGTDAYRTVTGTSFSCPVLTAKAGLHIASMETSPGGYPRRPSEVICALWQQTIPLDGSTYGIVDANADRKEFCPTVNPGGTGTGGGTVIIGPGDPVLGGPGSTINTLTVSPNPVRNSASLTIGGDVRGRATLSVMDSGGNMLLEQEVRSNKVDLSLDGFSPGMYWVSIRSSTSFVTKRVVKQ